MPVLGRFSGFFFEVFAGVAFAFVLLLLLTGRGRFAAAAMFGPPPRILCKLYGTE